MIRNHILKESDQEDQIWQCRTSSFPYYYKSSSYPYFLGSTPYSNELHQSKFWQARSTKSRCPNEVRNEWYFCKIYELKPQSSEVSIFWTLITESKTLKCHNILCDWYSSDFSKIFKLRTHRVAILGPHFNWFHLLHPPLLQCQKIIPRPARVNSKGGYELKMSDVMIRWERTKLSPVHCLLSSTFAISYGM